MNIELDSNYLNLNNIWQALSHPIIVITGNVSLHANLTNQGTALIAFKQSLNSYANITVLNSQIKIININYCEGIKNRTTKGLRKLLNNTKLQKIQNTFNNSQRVKFSRINTSYTIKDSIIKSKDLLLLNREYNITEHVVINLPSNLIVYQVQVKLLEHKNLKNIIILIQIKSKFNPLVVQITNNYNVIQLLQKNQLKNLNTKSINHF